MCPARTNASPTGPAMVVTDARASQPVKSALDDDRPHHWPRIDLKLFPILIDAGQRRRTFFALHWQVTQIGDAVFQGDQFESLPRIPGLPAGIHARVLVQPLLKFLDPREQGLNESHHLRRKRRHHLGGWFWHSHGPEITI